MSTIEIVAWCLVLAASVTGFALADRKWFFGPAVIALIVLVLLMVHQLPR